MSTLRNQFTFIVLAGLAVSMSGCGQHQADLLDSQENSKHSSKADENERTRPTNQVAVLTVWAEADKFEQNVNFYKHTLGLRDVGSGPTQHIFDTDGTFLVIMEGKLEHPRQLSKRWPLFALTVPNLNKSIESLKDSKTELPWGIEEYGTPSPSSRYIMFNDPAGNLIELVEWL